MLLPTLLLPALGIVWPLVETCRVLTTTPTAAAPEAVDHDDDDDDEEEEEEEEKQDERLQPLLQYWVVYLVGRLLLERPLDACLGGGAACQWAKAVLLLWLVWPPRRFHGAGVVVYYVLRPVLSGREAAIDAHLAAASTKARATARAAMKEIARALASTCLPAAVVRQLQPSEQRGGGGGGDNISTALAFVETARAYLGPLLAAKDEAAVE